MRKCGSLLSMYILGNSDVGEHLNLAVRLQVATTLLVVNETGRVKSLFRMMPKVLLSLQQTLIVWLVSFQFSVYLYGTSLLIVAHK